MSKLPHDPSTPTKEEADLARNVMSAHPMVGWSTSYKIARHLLKVGYRKVESSGASPDNTSVNGQYGMGYGSCKDCLPDGSCTMNCSGASPRTPPNATQALNGFPYTG